MAITIDYPTGVIFVPKADLAVVELTPFEIRAHDMLQFWRDLRAAEDTVEGRANPRILDSVPPDTTFQLARSVTLTPYYTVEYDDSNGTDAYRVNLINANTNVADKAVLNLVQVRPSNSSGLAVSGSGVTQANIDQIENQVHGRLIEAGLSFEDVSRIMLAYAAGDIIQQANGEAVIKSQDGTIDRIAVSPLANFGRDVTTVDGT